MECKGGISANDVDTNGSIESFNSIGYEVTEIRVALDMSQKEFADAILVSRATVNRFENNGEITNDIAFRLYYAMKKLQENVYISNEIKTLCKSLQDRIETECILPNTKYNPISHP